MLEDLRNQDEQKMQMRELGYVTAPEAARWARRSQRTIYRWLRRGELSCTHIGGRLYIPVASLREVVGPLATADPGQP